MDDIIEPLLWFAFIFCLLMIVLPPPNDEDDDG